MKWGKFVPIVLFTMVLLFASACGGGGTSPTLTPTPTATPTPMPTAAYGTYTDVVNGFSISLPEDWVEVPQLEYLCEILIGYCDLSLCGGLNSMSYVGHEKLQVSMSVQAYWESVKLQYATYKGYTYISEEEITICGLPAIKHVFTDIGGLGKTSKHVQALFIEGKTAWFIICASAENCWSQYETVFDTIINSFKLLD